MSINAEEAPLLEPTYAEKIQNLRLDKEIEFLKSLNRTYRIVDRNQVIVEGILHDNLDLHVHIPKDYPFREPLYADSSDPQALQPVSQAIEEWVPKFKILEVVELLALRINEKHEIKQRVSKYMLLKPFLEAKALPLIIILAVVLRILLGLGSYSGKGDYPNLGDFEAHRNWMSITINRPIASWYEESDAQPWWRIDYPPVAAYLSYFFGMIYRNIEPAALNIQRGYQSQSLKSFMRFSVLLVDAIFLIPPIVLLSKEMNKRIGYLLILVVLLKPDVILIDHGHFQYNSLILGLILLSFYFLLNKRYYLVCILYTIAVHSKQMATYYSLAFLAALVGLTFKEYYHNKVKIIAELAKYASIVVAVSLIIWAPWINSMEALTSVISAIFPVHRGLYQLKVPNFWCISDIVFKWQSHFSKNVLLIFCFASSIIASLPSIFSLLINPNRKSLTIGFATIALSFFMFSYHVHEKSILLPLLMIGFAGEFIGGWLAHDVIIAGCVGMFHLLKEDHQQLGYFALMVLYYMFHYSYVNVREELPQGYEEEIVLSWHRKLYSSRFLRVLIFGVLITLHINEKIITPPSSLPYLHHLLFAFFSFCFNCYFLLLGNMLQLEWIYQWLRERSKKAL